MAASAATLAKALVSTMLGILKSNFGIEMPRKLARRPQPLPPLKGEARGARPPWVRRGKRPKSQWQATENHRHPHVHGPRGAGVRQRRPARGRQAYFYAGKEINDPVTRSSVSSLQRIV